MCVCVLALCHTALVSAKFKRQATAVCCGLAASPSAASCGGEASKIHCLQTSPIWSFNLLGFSFKSGTDRVPFAGHFPVRHRDFFRNGELLSAWECTQTSLNCYAKKDKCDPSHS